MKRFFFILSILFLALSISADDADWPMAGANPQRTSWTPEEVPGQLEPKWFCVIEPYISQKVQLIAVKDTIYVSTAKGVIAVNADNGKIRWQYKTEMPIGHSPTVSNGVLYVGCFDNKIHAVDTKTGKKLWTFTGDAGFHTNPLVVDGKVYAGCRDNWFYCVDAKTGKLVWKYETQGPILYSAAYQDGEVYFASNDSHAYALNAKNGKLIWKSDKLPGHGFHSWWPVVLKDRVIFNGSHNYRTHVKPLTKGNGWDDANGRELYNIPDNFWSIPHAERVKRWPHGKLVAPRGKDGNIKADNVVEYFKKKPWRKTYFVLDRKTGKEKDIAPVLFSYTHSGNSYPPAIGKDGIPYQFNDYMFGDICGGHISGWIPGTNKITTPSKLWIAIDEPLAHSIGGNTVYWNHCCNRSAGSFNLATPVGHEEWLYGNYPLIKKFPKDYVDRRFTGVLSHGDQNAPIPFRGKVYMHRLNMIVCWGKK